MDVTMTDEHFLDSDDDNPQLLWERVTLDDEPETPLRDAKPPSSSGSWSTRLGNLLTRSGSGTQTPATSSIPTRTRPLNDWQRCEPTALFPEDEDPLRFSHCADMGMPGVSSEAPWFLLQQR